MKVTWDAVKAAATGTAPEKNAAIMSIHSIEDLASIPIATICKALAYYAYNVEYRTMRNSVMKVDEVKELIKKLRKEKGIGLAARRSPK